MCGIAGLIGRSPGAFPDQVSPGLVHRGPDDAGVWTSPDACLVHRRLAILDLTPNGHQPMSTPCGRWMIVFNGEIYNHNSLRHRLSALGYQFRGTGDTEVLLAWISRYGAAGLLDLRGMFAFCIYDLKEKTAFLARDPHGIKPLYYWQGRRGELAFSSELRSLLAWERISPRLNACALEGYLCTGSVAEPETLVEGVHRLPAGHWCLWSPGDGLRVQPWDPIPEELRPQDPPVSGSDALELTRRSLQSSLTAHLESDVPVALFLSGGLDSAALLALAPEELHTFTIGFPQPDAVHYDESSAAADIARHFGVPHQTLPLQALQLQHWLPEFLDSQDQPSIDGYNTWCISRLVRQHGFKVAISGLGGDELFGGYPSFQVVPRLHRWRRRLGSLGLPLARVLRRSPSGSRHRFQRIAALLESPPSLEASYRCFRSVFSPLEARSLMGCWGLDRSPDGPDDSPTAFHDLSCVESLSDVEAVAMLEGATYLRNQLLPDSDVMAMAAGLELRLPLVDAQLQHQLAVIPASQRLAARKDLLRKVVPELPDWYLRRPKQGFRFPFQLWLDADDSPLQFALPACAPGLDLRPWYRRWSLLILDHWLRSHLGVHLPRQHSSDFSPAAVR